MVTKTLKVPDYPQLFKHMALAIFRGKTLSGSAKKKFNDALEIALSRLTEYKLIQSSSSLARISLTGRGRQFETKHAREGKAASKSRLFDEYYKQFTAKQEEAEPDTEGDEQGKSFAPQKKLEKVGPQPENVVLKPDFKRVKPKKPTRLMPVGNPVRPKFTPNRPKKVTTAKRVARLSKATKARKARSGGRR
jgi:hypothetical protein